MIWAGMDEDKFLGPCKVCAEAGRTHEDGSPNRLRIIELKGGKRLSAARAISRPATIPRPPRTPTPVRSAARFPAAATSSGGWRSSCSVCGETPRLTVKGFRGRPWKLCLNDDCPTMVEMREKRAEREAAKEAREAAKEAEATATAPRPTAGPAAGQGEAERRPPPQAAPQTRAHQARGHAQELRRAAWRATT